MSLACLNNKYGIGEKCEKRNPITVTKSLFLTKPGFSFADASAFATEATWLTAIAAGNILPVQGIVNVESQDVETSYEDTATLDKIKTIEGRRGAMYEGLLPLESHQIARTYNDGNWRLIHGDATGNLVATENSDGTIQGFELTLLDVQFLNTPSGDSAVKTRIMIQEADNEEFDTFGVYLKPSWKPRRLWGADFVIQTQESNISTNEFTVSVAYVNQAKYDASGSEISEVISGLTVDNFKCVTAAGVVISIDSAVEDGSTDGLYTLTCTGIVAGDTCQVIASSANLYQSAIITLA